MHPHPREGIDVLAVVPPHQGTSYNPAADALRELLLQAHELEDQRVREAGQHAALKQKIGHESYFPLSFMASLSSIIALPAPNSVGSTMLLNGPLRGRLPICNK